MKNTFKVVFKIMVFTSLIFSLIISGCKKLGISRDSVKVGMVISITGWGGFLGGPQKNAMMAIVEDINRKGGILGKQVEAIIEDDKSDPTKALIAATKLVRDTKVDVLIGTTLTDCAQAIMPLIEQENIPFIVTTPVVAPFNKWVFYVGPGDVKMASHTLELAVKTLEAKRIALIHDSALYGTTGARIIKEEAGKYPGINIIKEETYEPTDTNMIPQLTKIKALKPDLIIIYGTGPGPAVIAKNYKQLGMKERVLGAGGLASPDFLKLGGGFIAEKNNWLIMVLKISVAEKLFEDNPYRLNVYDPFKKIYQDKFGKDKDITVFHVSPPDAVNVLVEAMKMAGKTDRNAIRDALEKVRYEGLLGNYAPGPEDHFEGAVDTSILAYLKKGEFVPYNITE